MVLVRAKRFFDDLKEFSNQNDNKRHQIRFIIRALEPLFQKQMVDVNDMMLKVDATNFQKEHVEFIREVLRTADFHTLPFTHIDTILRLTSRIREYDPIWEESYHRAYPLVVKRGGDVNEIFFGYGLPKEE